MKKYTSAIVVVALILFSPLLSCKKKDEKPPHAVYSVGFKVTGALVKGYYLTFQPNDSLGSYLWNFGDGAMTKVTTPVRMYATAGIYTVTMTVATDPSKKVSKEIRIFEDPVYTHLIAGVRNWRHQRYLYLSGGWDSTYYYPDAHFAVNYIDPVTVAIDYDTMYFDNSHSNDTVLIFGKSVQEFPGHGRTSYWTLYFDHVRDSIHYEKRPSGSAGSESHEDYNTKP